MKRILLALVAVAVLSSCGGFGTVAPREIVTTQASNTSTGQDSGILNDESGKEGFLVNQDWINGYDALLDRYGEKLFPPRKKGDRDGIKKVGKNRYRVSDAVMERQQVMNQKRSNGEP